MEQKKKAAGRPPGKSKTRETILASAQLLFTEQGYDASLKEIAAKANVDPALLIHYFGSKQKLFVAAMLPLYKAPAMLPKVFEGDRDQIGARFAMLIQHFLEDGETSKLLLALIKAASSNKDAAQMLREFIEPAIVQPLGRQLGGTHGQLVASFIGSQVVGLMMTRHIVELSPLAQATPKEIAAALGPIIQLYFNLETTHDER